MAKDSATQSKRFKEAARELGVELDEDQLRETLRKVSPVKKAKGVTEEGLGGFCGGLSNNRDH